MAQDLLGFSKKFVPVGTHSQVLQTVLQGFKKFRHNVRWKWQHHQKRQAQQETDTDNKEDENGLRSGCKLKSKKSPVADQKIEKALDEIARELISNIREKRGFRARSGGLFTLR